MDSTLISNVWLVEWLSVNLRNVNWNTFMQKKKMMNATSLRFADRAENVKLFRWVDSIFIESRMKSSR